MSLLSFWPDGEERARPNEQEVQRACEAHIQNVTGWASEPEGIQQFISSAYGVQQHHLGGGDAGAENQHEQDTATPQWLKLRKGRVTGTRVANIMGVGYDSEDQMLRTLDQPLPPFVRKLCQYGTANEPNADAAFELVREAGGLGDAWKSAVHDHPGLFLRPDMAWASGSPDGLLRQPDGTLGLVEYKCPAAKAKRDLTMADVASRGCIYDVKKSKMRGGAKTPVPQHYEAQMQWNAHMAPSPCAELFFCAWVADREGEACETRRLCDDQSFDGCTSSVWTTARGTVHIVRVAPDAGWFEKARVRCGEFWRDRMVRHQVLRAMGHLRSDELEGEVRWAKRSREDVAEEEE